MTGVKVDIYSPDWYLGDDVHETFAELRRSDPVHWQDMPGEPGYWAVLKHADLVEVARHPDVYSAWLGSVVLENLPTEQLEMMRHMLLVMDPPHHTAYRQPLAPHFGARVIGRMEQQIRERCRTILEMAGAKDEVDFVHEVAGPLPAQIIAGIMGLPQEDTPLIQQWAEVQTNGQDDEIAGSYEGNASLDMAMYGMQWAAKRRAEPRREDITALLLESTFEDGRQMDDIEFGGFFVQLVTAGNDTTKAMMSSGTHQLMLHPDQMQELRNDFSLIPNAVEEMLRYCNPLHYFRRTATRDTVLRDKQIKAGDKVAMYYTSANRDEDVFPNPQTFDIHRTPNPHLSFGIGAHFCLGAHLARLEAKIFFEELLSTFRSIELAGDPVKTRSNLNNGFKRMPVRLMSLEKGN